LLIVAIILEYLFDPQLLRVIDFDLYHLDHLGLKMEHLIFSDEEN